MKSQRKRLHQLSYKTQNNRVCGAMMKNSAQIWHANTYTICISTKLNKLCHNISTFVYLLNAIKKFPPEGCQTDFYKDAIGDEECDECPNREGKTNNTMHTGCECMKDRYPGDDEDGPCYGM